MMLLSVRMKFFLSVPAFEPLLDTSFGPAQLLSFVHPVCIALGRSLGHCYFYYCWSLAKAALRAQRLLQRQLHPRQQFRHPVSSQELPQPRLQLQYSPHLPATLQSARPAILRFNSGSVVAAPHKHTMPLTAPISSISPLQRVSLAVQLPKIVQITSMLSSHHAW